uniref:Uncharacterized protein n=1 Tax=Arundo donax TaxID=35708 RepID=A0A0A8XYC0_ARUDO
MSKENIRMEPSRRRGGSKGGNQSLPLDFIQPSQSLYIWMPRSASNTLMRGCSYFTTTHNHAPALVKGSCCCGKEERGGGATGAAAVSS